MSTVDLMLLGVLMQKPMNAYEMKKEMEHRSIQHWIKISSPSVYKNLVKLYKMGYVDGKIVREGEMPEKTIYSINEKGKNYFIHLMQHYSEEPGKIYMDFCAFISNLSNVDSKTGLQMIENLQKSLEFKLGAINYQFENMNRFPYDAKSIVNLYLQMYIILCKWIEDFKKQYTDHIERN